LPAGLTGCSVNDIDAVVFASPVRSAETPGGLSVEIHQRRKGDVLVLAPEGRMAIGADDLRVRDAIRKALDAGERKLLVDMARVSMLDSSGVGELVSGLTSTVKRGGTLKLAGLRPRALEVLSSTQLTDVFEIFDDESAALRSFV
jgi:anti-sigma B factor antagonist